MTISISGFSQTAKYSNEFLKIGVGARALGMSNAFVASADDVTSGYWNPAGLTRLNSDFQFSLMHSEYFAGIAAYDYAALATKLDSNSAIGFSFIRFGVDDIPNTTQLIDAEGNIDFNRVSSFSAADYAGLITYARKSGIEGLSYGANVKIIHRSVGDFAKAWGFGFDVGTQLVKDKWIFAATGRDITSTFNAWSSNLDKETEEVFILTGNELPENSVEVTLPELVLGISRKFIFSEKIGMRAELDLKNTFDGKRNVLVNSDPISIDPSIGIEATYADVIYLRGGIGNFQVTTDIDGNRITSFQPNFGIGVKLNRFSIDYALTDIGDRSVALYSNVFSLRIDITRK
ncbi:MAG: PorV/PorQ family protein [Flavobacteriales bacterium]|nr:PorV/PorQ family protein [Flavobacteriales bacterium]